MVHGFTVSYLTAIFPDLFWVPVKQTDLYGTTWYNQRPHSRANDAKEATLTTKEKAFFVGEIVYDVIAVVVIYFLIQHILNG